MLQIVLFGWRALSLYRSIALLPRLRLTLRFLCFIRTVKSVVVSLLDGYHHSFSGQRMWRLVCEWSIKLKSAIQSKKSAPNVPPTFYLLVFSRYSSFWAEYELLCFSWAAESTLCSPLCSLCVCVGGWGHVALRFNVLIENLLLLRKTDVLLL